MGALSNITFPSLLTAPSESQVLPKHKSPCSFMVPPSYYSVRPLSQICCKKLSESEVEENPTSSKRPSKSKDMMEDYNTAMKRMMRSPYEYHHDLGQFHLFPVCSPTTFAICKPRTFVVSLCLLPLNRRGIYTHQESFVFFIGFTMLYNASN